MSPEHLFNSSAQTVTTARRDRYSITKLITLFLGSLCLAAFIGRRLVLSSVEFSAGEVLSEKLTTLQTNVDDFNVFFLGTSHIYRGIDPDVFDEACRQAHLNTRSYNAGVFRLGSLEAETLLNTIIQNRQSAQPWTVIIEPSLRDCDFTNWTTERELFSHSPEKTLAAVESHWNGIKDMQSPFLMARHFAALSAHLGSGAMNQLNYGLASNVAFPDGQQFATRTYSSPPPNGFLPLDDEIARQQNGTPAATSLPRDVFAQVLRTGTDDRNAVTRSPIASGLRYYATLIERVEAAGGRILFAATPRMTVGAPVYGDDLEALLKSRPDMITARMLGDYRYSEELSEIFTCEHWFDPEHLNRKGAELFSQYLAADFVAHTLPTTPAHIDVSATHLRD